MLNDNIKNLRKAKGLSQEELAIKLNVVRQTVSKWENGISVPDSEMLIKIADALDTNVNTILGEPIITEDNSQLKEIASKLEVLNEQICRKNEHSRKTKHRAYLIATIFFCILLAYGLFEFVTSKIEMNGTIGIICGADGPTSNGPTSIYLSSVSIDGLVLILVILAVIISFIGLYKTRKR